MSLGIHVILFLQEAENVSGDTLEIDPDKENSSSWISLNIISETWKISETNS